jgi:hypothetical protein
MKTVVIGEAGGIVYSRALIEFARHYGFQPKACRTYRAKIKGKVERPYRYIREDFFLARSFRYLDDLNGFGSTRSLIRACTPRHDTWSTKPSRRKIPTWARSRSTLSAPCSSWNGGSPMKEWSARAAISTAFQMPPGNGLSIGPGVSARRIGVRGGSAFCGGLPRGRDRRVRVGVLVPESVRTKAFINSPIPAQPPRRRGRPSKNRASDQSTG